MIYGRIKSELTFIIFFPIDVFTVIFAFISVLPVFLNLFQYLSLSLHKYNSLYVSILEKSIAFKYFFNKLSTLGSKTIFKNLLLLLGKALCSNKVVIILSSDDLTECIVTLISKVFSNSINID